MGFIQLLASLWPFFKEMFIGDKIKDQTPSKGGATDKASEPKRDANHTATMARWCINKMQDSRRFLATVLVVLMLSLFVNYKMINKVITLMPQDGKQKGLPPSIVEPIDAPTDSLTVPKNAGSERDVLFEQTMSELKILYGAAR